MNELVMIYNKLLSHFGPQSWWPTNNNFTPREWEVCVGAVLTQNTNWSNVEKALKNLNNYHCRDAYTLMKTGNKRLENMIRSSGFYKQKAIKLKNLAEEVMKFGSTESFLKNVSREQLLNINGIGHETADSMLLYACNKPFFVIDAYTKRVFLRLGLIEENIEYEPTRKFFENNLPKNIDVYNEFHALIVKLGKNHCKKNPECEECPLNKECKYFISISAS